MPTPSLSRLLQPRLWFAESIIRRKVEELLSCVEEDARQPDLADTLCKQALLSAESDWYETPKDAAFTAVFLHQRNEIWKRVEQSTEVAKDNSSWWPEYHEYGCRKRGHSTFFEGDRVVLRGLNTTWEAQGRCDAMGGQCPKGGPKRGQDSFLSKRARLRDNIQACHDVSESPRADCCSTYREANSWRKPAGVVHPSTFARGVRDIADKAFASTVFPAIAAAGVRRAPLAATRHGGLPAAGRPRLAPPDRSPDCGPRRDPRGSRTVRSVRTPAG